MFESPKSKEQNRNSTTNRASAINGNTRSNFQRKDKTKTNVLFHSKSRSTSKICFSTTESAIRSGIVIKNSKLHSLSTLTEQSFLHTLALSSPQEEEGMVSYLYLGDEEKKKRELSVSFPKGARRLIGRCLYLRCFTLTPQLNDPECIVTFGRCALDPLSITFAGHRLLLMYPKATLLSLPRLFLARLHGSVTHGTSISRRRSKSASSRG